MAPPKITKFLSLPDATKLSLKITIHKQKYREIKSSWPPMAHKKRQIEIGIPVTK